ncbi:triple tyrosine motif-containing protein [Dysgonomonas capnocytophagoides]|uniref:triple tyrosine motif-containing protein n=1 Tax=Dysgonomonas capnocytophagoides TaxID=45254 RepID=UPI0030C80E0E
MAYKNNICITILLLLSCLASVIIANSKPHVINIYKEIYHAGNKNRAIGQDEHGIMYFGNDLGLLEYDGVEWQLHQNSNDPLVRSLFVLSNKTIFTGGCEEFGRWDRDISGKLKYTSLSESLDKSLLRNNDFWKICSAGNNIYFQSFNSIFIYDGNNVRKIPNGENFLFLSKVRNELIVQKMGGAIFRLNGENLEKIDGSDIFKNTDVRVILPYSNDKYLLGTATKGIFIYDGHSFTEWSKSLSTIMNAKELNCGIFTSRNTYYLGTILDGIYEVNESGEIINHISSNNMLQNNTVLSLYEDNLNNIWAGLYRGIAYMQYIQNMSCFSDPGGNTGPVYDATMWNNKLFIGTNQGVFYINESDMWGPNPLQNMKMVNGTQGKTWALEVVDDKLYCGHNRGLKIIDKNLNISSPYSLPGIYEISEAVINNKDVLLLSTYISLIIIEKKTGKIHNMDKIPDPIISSAIDHLGNIWLEQANRGIYRCRLSDNMEDITHFEYYGGDSKDGLPYKMKLFKVGGRIVLSGNDNFYTYDDIGDRIVPNNILNECFKNIKGIKRVVAIQKNTFWALTGSSVYKFTYDGYKASISESYNLGMNLSLVNTNENISVINDSVSIICLDNGYLFYRKKEENTHKQVPAPYLESLQASDSNGNSQYWSLSEYAGISYNYNNVTISFSAKNIFASNYAIQHKLKGIDNEWSKPEKINKVTYARLAKGKYTLMLRTIDNEGHVSDSLQYEFQIQPPWYQTFWAYILYILVFASAMYILWILILKRYRNLHLQKIRLRETKRLHLLAEELQNKVEQKEAELLTQTSYIIHKNELLLKIKDIVGDLNQQNKTSASVSLNQKINSLLNNNLNSEEDWKMFLIKFEEKHTGFFQKLKELYPQLTNSDLRLCACLRLNLETKEIASLMNLSVRTVENNRYRLRKKLNIPSTDNLIDFFLSKNI